MEYKCAECYKSTVPATKLLSSKPSFRSLINEVAVIAVAMKYIILESDTVIFNKYGFVS